MNLKLRSDVMHTTDPKVIFLARNLVCGNNKAYDTGFKPFYGDDANTDFKITLRIKSLGTNSNQAVAIGCKYEGTISGQQWPGFYTRWTTSKAFEVGGYNYWKPSVNDVVGTNLYIWRTGGNWYAQLEGESSPHTLSVRVASFNQPIVIGAGVQTNGTYFRYCDCVIDYIRIEYL